MTQQNQVKTKAKLSFAGIREMVNENQICLENGPPVEKLLDGNEQTCFQAKNYVTGR